MPSQKSTDSAGAGNSGSQSTDGVNLENHPDYGKVEIPTAEPPSEWHFSARRAELLDMVEQRGTAAALNGAELADRYDVSRTQIHKDLKVVKAYLADRIGDRDERGALVVSVAERAIDGLLEDGDYRSAFATAKEFDEWAEERHDVDELFRRVNAANSD